VLPIATGDIADTFGVDGTLVDTFPTGSIGRLPVTSTAPLD